MKTYARNLLLAGFALVVGAARPAHAQNVGVLPLPKPITRIVAIEPQNSLLTESTNEQDNDDKQYNLIIVQHVYVGVFAKLFGGAVIPTSEFVSPAAANNGGNRGFSSGFRGLNNNSTPSNGFGNQQQGGQITMPNFGNNRQLMSQLIRAPQRTGVN